MFSARLLLAVAALPLMAFSSPAEKRQAKPPAFFLAGDSTTAVNGGWGNGFISQLKAPAWGVNIGKSGATTRSYEAGGYWANITSHLRQYSFEYDSYVTISVSPTYFRFAHLRPSDYLANSLATMTRGQKTG